MSRCELQGFPRTTCENAQLCAVCTLMGRETSDCMVHICRKLFGEDKIQCKTCETEIMSGLPVRFDMMFMRH